MSKRHVQGTIALLMMLGVMVCGVTWARDAGHTPRVETGQSQEVGGITVYYGLMPAEIVGKHPDTHEEKTMHHGLYAKPEDYHLIVALFDKNGQRIRDASVVATIGEFGTAGIRKELEPMHVGDVGRSYGNFFALRRSGIYRIAIEVQRPAGTQGKPVEALFDYRLQ